MLIPKRIFAISKAAAKDQERYAMNGVCLQRTPDGRPLAVATDGHRLVVATWPEGKSEESGRKTICRDGLPTTVRTFRVHQWFSG